MNTTLDTSKWSLTTVQGYLSMAATFLLGLGPICAMYGHPKAAMASGFAAAVVGVAKAAVGSAQQDAGKQLAIPPGGTQPELMDAHRTPDDPAAKVVTK